MSGVPASIIAERVEYSARRQANHRVLRDYTRKPIQAEFASLDDFLTRWNSARRKQAIIEDAGRDGIVLDDLAAEVGKDYGDFDLICHVAFDQPPLTRKERADKVKEAKLLRQVRRQARAVLEALLDKYADEGISTLERR